MQNNVYPKPAIQTLQNLKSQGSPNNESLYPSTSVHGLNNIHSGVSSIYSSMLPSQSKVTSMGTNKIANGYYNSSMSPRQVHFKHPKKQQFVTWQTILNKLNDYENSSVEISRIITSFSNKMASLLLNTLDKIHGYTPNAMSNGVPILTDQERKILEQMKSKEDMNLC